jgi:hypothetical protein
VRIGTPLLYYGFDLLELAGKGFARLASGRMAQSALPTIYWSPVYRQWIVFRQVIKAKSARVVQEMQKRGLEGRIFPGDKKEIAVREAVVVRGDWAKSSNGVHEQGIASIGGSHGAERDSATTFR